MRIAFYSNYLNHHQLPICQALYRLTGGQFTFVATEAMQDYRKEMGYQDMDEQYAFVLKTYDNPENEELALQLAEECDLMIIGSAPEQYLQRRMAVGKPTFRYSERLYKQSYAQALSPRGQVFMQRNHRAYRNKPLYMLCASAYTAGDYGLSGAYVNKTYKWGYFPEVKELDPDMLWEKKRSSGKAKLLWVGRLISWKHPEAAIKAAKDLKACGYDFELNLIGGGELDARLKRMIRRHHLQDCVHLLGAMLPEQVREHMEACQVFLFTSDRGEGWGAVLNEAMNAGCAIVASNAIGSVGFLLEQRKNGLVYRDGDQKDLNGKVKALLDDPGLRERMGKAAYRTLTDTWNAETAARRVIALYKALANGRETPFGRGPCSVAERIYRFSAE